MGAWRIGLPLATLLLSVGSTAAQTYTLAEKAAQGDCIQTRLMMKLTGELRVVKDSKPAALKLSATGEHQFVERFLALDPHGQVEKVARAYESAKAVITLEANRSERSLPPERRLVVAQRHKGEGLIYAPAGPFSPEEFELVNGHFDSLALSGLLPGRAVKIGEPWKVTHEAAQALCFFEGLTGQDLECVLKEAKDGVARVEVHGTASGIDQGALVKVNVRATYRFDVGAGRLVGLEWAQTDERDQGPASPAANVESTVTLIRAAVAQPASLSDVALVSVPEGFDPPTNLVQFHYHHTGKGTFDLLYGREWQIVGRTDEHVVMRLLDRGDFVAQVTVTPWEQAKPGEHVSPQAFREAMAKTPGWEQGDVVDEGELPPESAGWLYRFSVPGRMDGTKVVQNFYLAAGPNGDQIVLAFTMTPAQASKLGTRDLTLVRGLTLPGQAAK